jgi:hypothetical protein
MRFLVTIRADADSEAGAMPSDELLTRMAAFNDELVAAGVMQGAEGLYPSSKGARVALAPDGTATVTDGPFAETKELIAGFWLWEAGSLDEAVAWARRIPIDPTATESGEVEIRQIASLDDFREEFGHDRAEDDGSRAAREDA